MPDKFSKEVRSKIMSKIRSRDTKPELILRDALRGSHLRYQPRLEGSPDFASKEKKVAVFVDGDFWHGYNWKVLGKVPPSGFWQKKILRNMNRDKRQTLKLKGNGWRVLRFHECDVLKNPKKCANSVKKAIYSKNL